jgi:hypothetical protein
VLDNKNRVLFHAKTMTRKERRTEAKKLAPVMAALNSNLIGAQKNDPLVGCFAKGWIGQGVVLQSKRVPEVLKQYAREMRRRRDSRFVLSKLHEELDRIFEKRAVGRKPVPAFVPQKHGEHSGSFQRAAVRFRKWIDVCAAGGANALLQKLFARRVRFSSTDATALEYLVRIAFLGVFRCQYVKCAKLALNTSGHASRRYCTGTNCARNDSQARIMARNFAKLQAGNIRRAKAAIAKWPGSGDLKKWIATQAAVTLRWVTEASNRGDIRLMERRV